MLYIAAIVIGIIAITGIRYYVQAKARAARKAIRARKRAIRRAVNARTVRARRAILHF